MKRRQMVVVVDYFPRPAKLGGGAYVRPFELVRELGSYRDHEVEVIQTYGSGPGWELGNATVHHLFDRPITRPLAELLRPFLLLAWLLRHTGRGTTIFNVVPRNVRVVARTIPANVWSRALEVAILAAMPRLGRRLWTQVDDDWTLIEYGRRRGVPGSLWRIRERLARHQTMILVASSHLVTAASDHMLSFVRQHAPDGVADRAIWSTWRAGVRPEMVELPRWEPPERTWTVGYIGSPHDAHLRMLIDAIRSTRARSQIEVRLAGAGMSDIPRPGGLDVVVDDSLRYLDFADFASSVDLWVIPYDGDEYLDRTWQLKVPMYLATGRPVIMTETNEMVNAGVSRFVRSAGTNVESLSRAIDATVEDPEATRSMADAARDYVLKTFDWGRDIRGFVELIDA